MNVTVSGLHKTYGRTVAVNDVTISVGSGQCYALIGPNGAGKTTLIKCLLRLCRWYQGEILADGHPLPRAMQRQQVGYLPERLILPQMVTGIDYLKEQAHVRGIPWRKLKPEIERLVDALSLTDKLDALLGHYSKGMSRKIGFIQAVMHRPRLLVLDEPTEGLDPVARRIVLGLTSELKRNGTTVLITSHLLADLERVSDRAGIMVDGVLAGEICLADLKRQSVCQVTVRHGDRARSLTMEVGQSVEFDGVSWAVESVDVSSGGLEDWYHTIVAQTEEVVR